MANLFIVSTPIGNLEDISKRALRILSEVDLVLSEDTRIIKKIINYYNIKAQALSYHQHSNDKKINQIIDYLKEGKDLALVSDAGTPGISDPGNKLIKEIIKKNIKFLKIIPIPGPSALIAAASISGFPMEKFIFLGFPPIRKKRDKFFKEIVDSKYPIIFYESRHRILKTLSEISFTNKDFEVVVCREMTKKFETIYRGKIKEIVKEIEEIFKKGELKGEFTVVIKQEKNEK